MKNTGGNKLFYKTPFMRLVALAISLIGVGFIYVSVYISTVKATQYHNEFKKSEFNKLKIEIRNNYYIERKVQVEIEDNDEIKFYRDLFANALVKKPIKQGKLYHYSVFITFWDVEDEVFVFKVFFDKEKAELRPVVLRINGDSTGLGGYEFTLEDAGFKLYNQIIKLLDDI